jgi:2-iminobutanoate/2-iminopropanoate deaminase
MKLKQFLLFKNINKKTFMQKNLIESLNSSKTPVAIGPYSKATRVDMGVNNMIFCSGSLGVNPVTGDLLETVSGQAKQSLENLKNLLE